MLKTKLSLCFVVAFVAAAVFGGEVRKEESVLARRRWRRFAALRDKIRQKEIWWC
ncbi:hypothetical protein BDL97_05G137600 [Sphagnum fallax]|nr:hypothetical protein BDL97_05G137600 [Sphagnum fallax]